MEWLVDATQLAEPVDVPTIVNLVFPPLQECRCPISVYGKSVTSGKWVRLPDVIMQQEMDMAMFDIDSEADMSGYEMDSDAESDGAAEESEGEEFGDKVSMKRSRTNDGETNDCEGADAVKRRKENTDGSDVEDEEDDALLDETSEFAQNLMRQWEAQMGAGGDQSSDDEGEYDSYSDLTFGIWLLSDGSKTENQIELMDEESLQNCQEILTEALAELKPKSIKARSSAKAGSAAALQANEYVPVGDEEIYLTLKPKGDSMTFKTEPLDIYRTLLEMDLQYAQGQFLCFAEITEADGGEDNDCIFSVDVKMGEDKATTDTPKTIPDSMKLGFYLPHNVAPREVVHILVKTAKTLQSKFGGEIHMDKYRNEDALRAVVDRVERICTVMETQLGVYPGTMDAHFLYN